MRIEVFRVFGDIGQGPIPEGQDFQVLRDTGFRFTGRFCDDYLTNDAAAKSKHPQEVAMQEHTIAEVTELFIYVKGLRGHVNGNLVMALELEKITDLGLEGLIVTVVPNHTDFVQEKERIRFRDEIAQVLYIKMAYTRDKQFVHVGVNVPMLFPF